MHNKHHRRGGPHWEREERWEEHRPEPEHHGHHGPPPFVDHLREAWGAGPGFARPFVAPFGRGRPFRGHFRFGPRGGRPFGGGPFGGPFGGGPFGGGPFGDDPGDRGGRRRQRRGDIKFALLELLAEQPRHGYDLIKELEQRYSGFYRPSPGSVYPTLQLLEDNGSVVSEQVEGKRVYTITDSGRKELAERQQSTPEGERGPGGPPADLEQLRHSAMALQSSIMQVARHGTTEQRSAVQKRLDAVRREIYGILAQADESETI